MKLWFNLRDLISFQIPDHNRDISPLSGNYKDFLMGGASTAHHVALQNIRFDNSMRIWISLLSFAACIVLWWGKFISTFTPIAILLGIYGAIEVGASLILARVRIQRQQRQINYLLCTVDLIGISLVIYWTGGASSPFYFLYFMPLIIQAFHRDWSLLLFYGFGGIFLYAVAVLLSIDKLSSPQLVDLGARIFLMLLTVSIAFLAVNLLRNKERLERIQLSRVKFLTYMSQNLNRIDSIKELPGMLKEFIQLLNIETKDSIDAWSRVFIADLEQPHLVAIEDPSYPRDDLKQFLSSHACPALDGRVLFKVDNSEKETGCPTETLDFKSHVCVPINGSQNESYGVLFSGSTQPNAYQMEEISFLQFIAKSVGLTVQRLKRIEELRQAYELDSFAMACFMESFRHPETTYDAILEGFNSFLKVEELMLLLWNPSERLLSLAQAKGPLKPNVKETVWHMGEGIPGRVLESGAPYWTYDLTPQQSSSPIDKEFKSLLCIPLQTIKGEPLGVLMASSLTGQKLFTVEEINLASTFATRASVSIENAALHKQEKEAILIINPSSPDQKAA